MIELERSILGQIFVYPNTHTYIPKMKPMYFTDWRVDIVTTMQEMYLTNEPISLYTLGIKHRNHMAEIAQLQNYVTNSLNFERELLQLEVAYKKYQLQQKIAYLNFDKHLDELIDEINVLLVESMVHVNGQSKPMGLVAGEVIDTLEEAIERGTNMTGIQTGWK